MIVNVKDLSEWRKQHPDEKSVMVRHSDSIALWEFRVKDPQNLTFVDRFGLYTGDGRFVFYDADGNRHTVFNNMYKRIRL